MLLYSCLVPYDSTKPFVWSEYLTACGAKAVPNIVFKQVSTANTIDNIVTILLYWSYCMHLLPKLTVKNAVSLVLWGENWSTVNTRFIGPVNVVLFNFLTWQQLDEFETLIQLTVLITVIRLSGVQFGLYSYVRLKSKGLLVSNDKNGDKYQNTPADMAYLSLTF